MKNKTVLIILLFLLFSAAFLRLLGVFTNSFAFTYDVGRDMLKIAEIVYQHKIPLIGFTTGIEGIFYGPWWYYILTFPFLISGGNPQFIAGFIAFTGILTVFLLFVFGQEIQDSYFGLLLAFLAAFSTSLIGISTQIWNPNIAPILIILNLFIIYKLFKNPGIWTYFFFGLVLTLLMDTEIVFGILHLIGTLIGLFIISKKIILNKKMLFFIPGALLVLAPRIIFELRHNFLMAQNFYHFVTSQKEATLGITPVSIINKLDIFFGLFADTITGTSKLIAAPLLLIIAISIFLTFKKTKANLKKFLILTLAIISIFIIGIVLFSHDIWPHYLIGLPVYFCLLTAIPLFTFFKSHNYAKFTVFLILIAISWGNVIKLHSQVSADLKRPIWEGNAAVYRNQLAVVDYIYNEAKGKEYNYIAYSPAIFSYPYDYLLTWYGLKKYNYAPSVEHRKLFFVIIEPDFDHPFLLKQWLKLREKDGKIIKEQKVKGGVIVQTRIH